MKQTLLSFITDLVTAGVTGAAGVLAVTNLDIANPKVLAVALAIGFLNGAVNAARRYALAVRTPAQ